MKQETLSVSAIVLVSDRDKFLAETIDSIKKQDRQLLEIIVIDGSSQGDAAEIVQQFTGIQYHRQPDRDRAFNINLGIEKSQGDAIAFLNTGDLWTRHKLTNQIVYLETHPDVKIVQGFIRNVSDTFRYANHIETFICTYDFINLGSLIFRKSVFDKVGMLDESLDLEAEIDWFVRAWEHNILKVKLELVTLLYRPRNPQSLTESTRSFQLRLLKVIKKHIDRQKSDRSNENPRSRFDYKYIGRPCEELGTDFQPFTIVSDDCWSYGPYNALQIQYDTPFIDIRIEIPCYLELLKDLQNYVRSPLTFTNTSRYEHVNRWRDKDSLNFPIARLKDKIELQFVHESDEDVCRAKWARRMERIHWDNLFIKFRDDDRGSLSEDHLNEFDRLQYENKICFARQEYPQYKWAIAAPDYFKSISEGNDIYDASKKYFDAVNWVKKTHGSNLSAYKIQQLVLSGGSLDTISFVQILPPPSSLPPFANSTVIYAAQY